MADLFEGGKLTTTIPIASVRDAPVSLERDVFLRTLVRELANVLDRTVGEAEAESFISMVGQAMGRQIDRMYKAELGTVRLDVEQVASILIDLKQRIQGDFHLVELTAEKMVFANYACPFAEKVVGRRSMCMMTSNVFGVITANNLGYGMVALEQTIADGDPACRVTVHLKPTPAAMAAEGREYLAT